VVVLWDCVLVRGLTALLARAARVAVLFAVVSSTAFAGGRAAPAPVVGATERAEIAGAFGRFFTGALSPTAAGRFVQAGDAPIADALNQAFEGVFMGFTHSQVRVTSVARSTAMVARVRFEVDVAFRGGFDRQLFTGAAVERAGRWKVGWATACFVAETFSVRCPSAPAGAAVLPIPTAPLAAQYTRPSAAGLIRPQELAVAPNGDLLIVDPQRDQVFRRTADGDLRLVAGTGAAGFAGDGGPAVAAEFNDPEGIVAAPDGTIYVADAGNDRVRAIAPDGTINTVVAHLPQPTGLALAADGTLYVADGKAVVTISPSGTVRTFVTGKGRYHQITVGSKDYGAFFPMWLALDGSGDVDVFSFSPKLIFEFNPEGVPLRAWPAYATGLATAPDGSVIVASHGVALARIEGAKLSTVLDFSKTAIAGYPAPNSGNGGFQPDGVAITPDGTIYTDTDVGNGFSEQTALAQITSAGQASVLPVTTPLTETFPGTGAPGFPAALYPAPLPARTAGDPNACPAPTGLQNFDTNARAEATTAAKQLDTDFYGGLRVSDRAWWPGYYTDQIDNSYETGRHAVIQVRPAASDIYAPAVRRACGAALLDRSLEITIGRSAYSFQISHLYFVDRDGHALLYWQHT
jgi:sugar lactone lactonase YvrE